MLLPTRLTPSLVLRALCMGDMEFFEAALAVMAGIPVENAAILVHDGGKRGLTMLCGKAGLAAPPVLPVVHIAVDVADARLGVKIVLVAFAHLREAGDSKQHFVVHDRHVECTFKLSGIIVPAANCEVPSQIVAGLLGGE